jgi:hypothetical protein
MEGNEMAKDTITIKNENVFFEYLYARLNNGITEGITEEEYYSFLNLLLEKVNTDESTYAIKAISPSETFSTIAEKAIEKTSSAYNKNLKGLDFKNGIIYPNYNLRKLEWNKYMLFISHGRERTLTDKTIKQIVKVPNLSEYSLREANAANFKIAEQIAAYFVNDLIERYLAKKIENGLWPKQCRNVDEFVFNRNIGKAINEEGTKENFQIAYYQAIRIITELLETRQSSNDYLMFSNNSANCLAYANYLKIIIPEVLSFLLPYRYYESELRNASINVSVVNNKAQFKNSECVFSDPYGEWSDDYKQTEGSISDDPVLVMEKRIGKVLKQ